MRVKIGFITIGQSPREDIVSEMTDLLGSGIEISERGALDGLSRIEIDKLKPEKNDFSLITRLQDRTSVVVGKKKMTPLGQERVHELEKEGAQIIGFLCTEDFPEIKSRCLLLFPSRILFHTVLATLSKGKLGVFVPLEGQIDDVRKKWEKTGLKVVVEALNPYGNSSEMKEALERIKKEKVDLIILDCVGYPLKTKERIRRETGKPVLLPRTLLAKMMRELIG